jgi:hypothetical protein
MPYTSIRGFPYLMVAFELAQVITKESNRSNNFDKISSLPMNLSSITVLVNEYRSYQ